MHPDDAARALDAGVDGVWVSNHGGRQIDQSVPTLAALPDVVERVGGRVPVVFDSGVRQGADAFIALALGATAVAIGRPYAYGLGDRRRGRGARGHPQSPRRARHHAGALGRTSRSTDVGPRRAPRGVTGRSPARPTRDVAVARRNGGTYAVRHAPSPSADAGHRGPVLAPTNRDRDPHVRRLAGAVAPDRRARAHRRCTGRRAGWRRLRRRRLRRRRLHAASSVATSSEKVNMLDALADAFKESPEHEALDECATVRPINVSSGDATRYPHRRAATGRTRTRAAGRRMWSPASTVWTERVAAAASPSLVGEPESFTHTPVVFGVPETMAQGARLARRPRSASPTSSSLCQTPRAGGASASRCGDRSRSRRPTRTPRPPGSRRS